MPTTDPFHENSWPRLLEDDARGVEVLAPAAPADLVLRPEAVCLQRWMDLSA